MAADKNSPPVKPGDTILDGKNASPIKSGIDDSSLDQVWSPGSTGGEEDDLEAQMAAAMEAEGSLGGGADDLESQMAATMALEANGGDLDLEAQMTQAMDEEGLSDIGDALDLGDQEVESPGLAEGPVKPLKFPQLHPSDEGIDSESIDRLMDVSLNVSVELGRKQMLIKEILGLGPGKIIELDKLAGEPVDLLVNGKLLAKGEVVVVDENFGVRITDLINPRDRIKML